MATHKISSFRHIRGEMQKPYCNIPFRNVLEWDRWGFCGPAYSRSSANVSLTRALYAVLEYIFAKKDATVVSFDAMSSNRDLCGGKPESRPTRHSMASSTMLNTCISLYNGAPASRASFSSLLSSLAVPEAAEAEEECCPESSSEEALEESCPSSSSEEAVEEPSSEAA